MLHSWLRSCVGGKGGLPLRATSIRAYDDGFADIQIVSDPPKRTGLRVQVVHGHIEEPLDLTRMQVHGDDMIAAGCLQHIRHEFCSDGSTGSVFLVLTGIGEVGDHGGDTTGRCSLAGVDDDEEFHEAVIDVARSGGLEDEDSEFNVSFMSP